MSKKVLFKAKRIESLQDVVTKGSHRCPHCEKLFLSKFCLARHVRIHKEAEVKKFECIVCKKRFNEIANYLRHCMFHDMNRHISKGESFVVEFLLRFKMFKDKDDLTRRVFVVVSGSSLIVARWVQLYHTCG